MTKTIIILLCISFINIHSTIHCQGQEIQEKNFLFRSEKVQLSTFYVEINPMTSFTRLNQQSVNVFAIEAGFILNDKFSLSFFSASTGNVNLIPVPEAGSDAYYRWIEAGVKLNQISSSTELLYVDFRHSGLKFGYMHNTSNIVFWKANLTFGFLGGLTMSENKTFMGWFNNNVYQESVVSLEPSLGMGVNLLPWWRISLDAGYRFMGADDRIMSAADADSFTFSLSFAFGKFGE